MFGLFKSNKEKMKDKVESAFNRMLTSIDGFTTAEIGYILDLAIRVKDASILLEPNGSSNILAYEDPLHLGEDASMEYLEHWIKIMENWETMPEHQQKISGLMIWWLSLASCTFPDQRANGRKLWLYLIASFNNCSPPAQFDLIPKGLEPSWAIVQ
jgi:hypothetical protein